MVLFCFSILYFRSLLNPIQDALCYCWFSFFLRICADHVVILYVCGRQNKSDLARIVRKTREQNIGLVVGWVAVNEFVGAFSCQQDVIVHFAHPIGLQIRSHSYSHEHSLVFDNAVSVRKKWLCFQPT